VDRPKVRWATAIVAVIIGGFSFWLVAGDPTQNIRVVRFLVRWIFAVSILGWLPMLGLMYAIWLRKSDGQTQRLSKQIRFNDGRISAMQAVLDDTMARVKRIETTTSKWDGLAEEIVRLGLAVKALETNTGMLAAFMPNQGEQNPK
jgi:hypothetical protein